MRSLRLAPVALLLSLCLVGACSSDAVTDASDSVIATDWQTMGDHVDVPSGDGLDEEVAPGETIGDDTETPPPEEGTLGAPCDENDDCNSGYCISTADGDVCTKTCENECPAGWVCSQLVVDGDPVFLCVPRWMHLCDPCGEASDCSQGAWDTGHYCLDWGDGGHFCGGACEDDICPSGYSCQSVPIPGDSTAKQCMPDEGACSCSTLATELQLGTTCAITVGEDSCEGARFCGPDGLTACDAQTPAEESCNGADDDCDGQTDEMPEGYQCSYTIEGVGTCYGAGSCVGGVESCDAPQPMPELCDGVDNDCDGETDEIFTDTDGDGQANCIDEDDDDDGVPDTDDNCVVDPNPEQDNHDGDPMGDVCDDDDDNDSMVDTLDCAPFDATIVTGAQEFCDGIDNDCDGETDEGTCPDGNPCTEDLCNGSTCENTPLNSVPCDDGSVCTQIDLCQDGSCNGLSPLICNDGNPCTDDWCDGAVGCLTNFNTAPCEDGEPCTSGDTCQVGVCQAGGPTQCEGAACTTGTCVPGVGCQYTNTSGGYCGTGSPDCPSGTCSNGACMMTPGQTCDYDPGICGADVPGTCTSAGECIPVATAGCDCGVCNGICICCYVGGFFPINVCIPF